MFHYCLYSPVMSFEATSTSVPTLRLMKNLALTNAMAESQGSPLVNLDWGHVQVPETTIKHFPYANAHLGPKIFFDC